MGPVKVSAHPPLLLAPAGADPGAPELVRYDHAALWLSVEVETWQVRRSGHLHLVRDPGEATWREVDLGRHPLRALPEAPGEGGVRLEDDLAAALASRTLRLFRIPALAVVSEIGEGREDFRRRATGGLRPQLQRRLEAEAAPRSSSWLPWRRRAAERAAAAHKEQLAAELSALAGSIETLELEDLGRYVRRAEVGALLVAPGVTLEAPKYRPLMI
jgi:hypothetical protein